MRYFRHIDIIDAGLLRSDAARNQRTKTPLNTPIDLFTTSNIIFDDPQNRK